MRLVCQRLRQARLLQQHRDGVGFCPAVGGGNRGPGDGLRQNLLGKIEERLPRFIDRAADVIAFIGGAGKQGRQLGQRLVVFQLFQIVENGLFNQPMRRAVNTARGELDAFTRRVVKLNTHGSGAHAYHSCYESLFFFAVTRKYPLCCNFVQPC